MNFGAGNWADLQARNEHHERTGDLFSIVAHLPKLDVAGSIPVSRSFLFNNLLPSAPSRSLKAFP
jgi:hypothetical protein